MVMSKTALGWTVAIGFAVGLVPLSPAPAFAQAAPTFSADVAPILQQRCQTCHRRGQMAPMSLVTYEEVRPWARAIRTKVAERSMPPWHIDKTIGIQAFDNDISLSAAEIDAIVDWVDAGAPRGNPADMPPAVAWPADDIWRLEARYGRPPDLVVSSPPWTQGAEGQDQWWQPVVDTGLTEDRWATGIEIRPTIEARRVTHHSNVYLLQEEDPGDHVAAVDVTPRGSYFSEFAIGKIGDVFRENTGKLLKAGARFTFDNHYHSVGEAVVAQTDVGVWFYPPGVVPKYPRLRPGHGRAAVPADHGPAARQDHGAPRLRPAACSGPPRKLPAAHAHPRQVDVDGGDPSGRPGGDAEPRRELRLQLARQLRLHGRIGAGAAGRHGHPHHRLARQHGRQPQQSPIRANGWDGASAATTTCTTPTST